MVAMTRDKEFPRDDLLRKTPLPRGTPAAPFANDVSNELVFKCRTCTDGRVVFTRRELEAIAKQM